MKRYVATVHYNNGRFQSVAITLKDLDDREIVEGYREVIRVDKDAVSRVEVYYSNENELRNMTDDELSDVSHFTTYFIPHRSRAGGPPIL